MCDRVHAHVLCAVPGHVGEQETSVPSLQGVQHVVRACSMLVCVHLVMRCAHVRIMQLFGMGHAVHGGPATSRQWQLEFRQAGNGSSLCAALPCAHLGY